MKGSIDKADAASARTAPAPRDLWLAQALADAGLVSVSRIGQLAGSGASSIWEALVRQEVLSDEQILEALTQRFKVPPADLGAVDPRVVTLLPESVARKYRIVALGADDRTIRIATSDPRDVSLEQTLAFVTGRAVSLCLAAPSAIAAKVEELYRPETTINRLVDGLDPVSVETIDEMPPLAAGPEQTTLEAPMARLVDAMISDGVRERASDIHCEPLSECTSIRYRIDGVLKEVMRLPASAGPALVRRVKILAKLDVTDPLRPHDGRCAIKVDGHPIDLRVSTAPVARRGEKVVIRILDKANLRASIPDLELEEGEERLLHQALGHREGIILVTGPTGSGKTTTLYAAINQLKAEPVNIVTVEDPVEYDVPGISQLQVNEAQGFTFATALRSVLRQDPDIVLVGEIRDVETAGIAVQAGLSGHLVLSTLHTNDAASAMVRLNDLGVDRFKIASVVKAVAAQRLVRRLCAACAVEVGIEELPEAARPPAGHRRPVTPRRAVGCKACGGTGYRGRTMVIEVLPVDEKVAELISTGALPERILGAARRLGLHSLWESGLARVWSGVTSFEEATRVLGDLEHAPGAHPPANPALTPDTAGATPTPDRRASVDGSAGPRGSRVLVADDDRQMRRLVRVILEREGFEVIEAADGLDALDAVETGHLDLMILDLDMPRLDGMGVLQELRARLLTASVPVIVLTARTGESEVQVLDLGAQDFLTKPVQPPSLQARVRAVLRRTAIG
ncbi:MAG: ATPase, T2SS/T4P/T4SS family [Gemmatimonadales bacterium]